MRDRTGAWLAACAAALSVGLPPVVEAAAPPRAAPAAQAALAQVDSLLAAGAVSAAVATALDGVRRWADEPLYGWQLRGRAGAALVAAGRPAEALDLLESALRTQPRDGALHHQLGLALVALGRRGRALAEFDQAAASDPAAVAPRLEAGRLRGALGDWRGAGLVLEEARALCGGCPEPDRLQGTILLAAGRPAEALVPLRRLWASRPDADVRRHLLAALAEAREDSALLDLVTSTPAAERTGDDWSMAIQAERRRGGCAWAAAALTAAESGDAAAVPLEADLFWAQASLNLLAAGQAASALAAIDRAVALAPNSAVYRHNRAAVLAALGRHAEARRALEAADEAAGRGGRGDRP